MSKPVPLEYKLVGWDVSYKYGGYDIGTIGPDPVDWHASITWSVGLKELKDITETNSFRTFNDARAWIEKETTLKYAGFSDSLPTSDEDNKEEL